MNTCIDKSCCKCKEIKSIDSFKIVKRKGKFRYDFRCIECVKQQKKEAYLKSRQKNLDYTKAYVAKNKERYLAHWKNRYTNKKEIISEQKRKKYCPLKKKAFYEANKIKYLEESRAYYDKNKEKTADRVRRYVKNNKEKIRAFYSKHRANKLNAVPKWLSKEHKKEIYALYKYSMEITKETGIKHEVDHIVPIKSSLVCGLHVPWNLRVITMVENRKKSNKLEGNLCQL